MRISGFWNFCAGLWFAVILSGHVHAADTVALVSDVSGNVAVKTDGGSSPAKLLASIPLGSRIDLPAGAALTLIYVVKGEEYKLSGPGSYQADASSPQTINGSAPLKRASLSGVLGGKRIRSENVSQASLSMRGGKKAPHSLEPLSPSGQVTLADPLKLGWRAPIDGLVYQIQLIDSQRRVLVNQEVTGNAYTLPQEIKLSGGGYYVWSLSTTIPDGSLITSSARFKVASNEIRELAAKIRPDKDGTVSERVVFGLWLEAQDLVNEAHQVWGELAAEFPDHPNLFERAVLEP